MGLDAFLFFHEVLVCFAEQQLNTLEHLDADSLRVTFALYGHQLRLQVTRIFLKLSLHPRNAAVRDVARLTTDVDTRLVVCGVSSHVANDLVLINKHLEISQVELHLELE